MYAELEGQAGVVLVWVLMCHHDGSVEPLTISHLFNVFLLTQIW